MPQERFRSIFRVDNSVGRFGATDRVDVSALWKHNDGPVRGHVVLSQRVHHDHVYAMILRIDKMCYDSVVGSVLDPPKNTKKALSSW